MRKITKKIAWGLLTMIVVLAIWQHEMIGYGLSQGYGQFKVLYNAESVEKALQDKTFPDSLKQKLLLIQEIRKYAIDSLGLNESKSYTTIYNQHGKAILWNVTAAEPFALKAKEWKFPFLGTFSYKGFFDLEKAKKEEKVLRNNGYDTDIGVVGGWSTLGWFRDPILSNML
jgi:predicted aminopeptidase